MARISRSCQTAGSCVKVEELCSTFALALQTEPMQSADKKLNEMNRLADMGHFPAVVNAGATVNILITTCATYWLAGRYAQPYAPVLWIAAVLVLNLLPVVLLRLTMTPGTRYPTLRDMSFAGDQHKFSDWVYLAASANMAFWVLSSWAILSVRHTVPVLAAVLVVEAIVTFSPVLLRKQQR